MARGSRKDALKGSAAAIPPASGKPKIVLDRGSLTEPVVLNLKPEDVQFLEAPEIYATGSQLSLMQNDFIITLTRPRLATANIGGEATQVATAIPVAYVTMSPGALKDFAAVIKDVIDRYESEMGTITTPFLKARAEAAESAPK